MIKGVFNKYLGLLLVSGAFILGLATYKSYGVSWDEKAMRDLGVYNYSYFFQGSDSSLLLFDSKYFNANEGSAKFLPGMKLYGVAFELPLVALEKVFNLQDSRDIYLMRHLATYLFFLLGAFSFFLLIDYLYHSKLLAAIGFLLLVVNPLIYGHSFINTRDIPVMSMFIICFLITAVAFNKNTAKWYILLGAACAILTNMRVIGLLLVGCIWIFFVLDYIALKQDKEAKKKTIFYFFIFTITSFLVLYITWPYLYPNPIKNFIGIIREMSKYPLTEGILFMSKWTSIAKLPRYYSIFWFCISNPVIYLGLGFSGIVYFIIRFIKTPKLFIFDKQSRNNSLFLFCFIGPLIIIFVFHSVLFHTWRHLYFIYPSFILIGLFWLDYLLKTKAKVFILFLLMADISYTGFYMVSNFPFEYVYFNEIVELRDFVVKAPPEYLRKSFEMDYWAISYKQGLEYILKNDTAHNLNISPNVFGLLGNSLLLKPEQRKRINLTDSLSQANYYIGIYDSHSQDYPFEQREVYTIKVFNSKIMSVFKLK